MDYTQLSKDELLQLWKDPEADGTARDKAYAELERRRLATMSDRHSEDDEPEG